MSPIGFLASSLYLFELGVVEAYEMLSCFGIGIREFLEKLRNQRLVLFVFAKE